MEKKTDRRIRKTKANLRSGLAQLMQSKSISEITVQELVDLVDINRSTFYLHYSDIYNMLTEIENDLFLEIKEAFNDHSPNLDENTYAFITEIFNMLSNNKEICRALIGPYGDIAFIHKTEKIIAEHSLTKLEKLFPELKNDVQYTFNFCLSGCIGLIRTWLNDNNASSPEHMARLTYNMIVNSLKSFYKI